MPEKRTKLDRFLTELRPPPMSSSMTRTGRGWVLSDARELASGCDVGGGEAGPGE